MEIRYDHISDAMYIRLTDKPVFKTRRVAPNLNVDLDSNDQVIGMEVVSVRAAGTNPLTMSIMQITTAEAVERPDQEAIIQERIARREALKEQQNADAS
jgi:uncharacterized protein YuzE